MSYIIEHDSSTKISSIVFHDAAGKHTVYRMASYTVAVEVCRLLNKAHTSGYEAGHRAGFAQAMNVERDARAAAMQRHPSS